VGDTCSGCHLAALKQSIGRVDHEVIFASFHVDVAETPFFVAIDYDHQSVVVSIRGTISMKVLGDRSMKINQISNLSVSVTVTGRDNGSSRRSGAHSSPVDARRLVWAQGIEFI
jgi:hypothetical protein